jgi:rhamnosyltransferase
MPETSILIRTKNEEKWIGECLQRLAAQTYKDFEIIIVDSGSTDRTLEIVKNFNVRLFQIKSEEFTYSYALNFACQKAEAKKYFAILSGHSLPCSQNWLKNGIEDFNDRKIAGVYGPVWALPDGYIWEKLIFNKYINIFRHAFVGRKRIVKEAVMGVLGNTNALIRRDLWDQHHFDEAYGAGGEDGEWGRYWLTRGYVAIRDLRFAVYHSHGLSYQDLKKQQANWRSLIKPQPFYFPDFRKKKNN